ncbi:interleukin-1 receptor type 2 [Scleropages formosus]|uniref:Ig-like domain-containing protein n=1 Tax=Scleropages formosus TaxID=113540 RepID=A0A8C9QYS8_SCLFO|nr:interleukin-1 receptor type 2 [Scleropages formosus]
MSHNGSMACRDQVLVALLLACFTSKTAPLSLPVTENCLQVSEIEEFHLQGEAVVLSCPKAERVVLKNRLLHTPGYTQHFAGAAMRPLDTNGRVRDRGRRLWFLPAQTSDTGNYTCVFRNRTFCIAGIISLQVYERKGPHLDMISYPNFVFPGHTGLVVCPNLKEYNRTGNLQWFKESTPIELSVNGTRYHQQEANVLAIQDINPQDKGFYTCELWILFDQTRFKITRTIKLVVAAPEEETTTLQTSPAVIPTRPPHPPEIVYPAHGDVFIAIIDSTLEIPCRVSTGDQPANSTEVTWLVNGLNIEESVLRGRAFLGERVISRSERTLIELKIIILELHEEDSSAEIKCVARSPGGRRDVVAQVRVEDPFVWLTVGCIGAAAFLTTVSLFLYLLLKPERKDYVLARQSSVL